MRLAIGPLIVAVTGGSRSFDGTFTLMYGDFPVRQDALADFHVAMSRPNSARRWLKPQVLFKLDNQSLFDPFPLDTAFPMFEWGLNWSIGQRAHQYLLLHAATLERGGRAVLMPAIPGSGKSTLCAAMAHRGWRLLSDEFGMFDLRRRCLAPVPRPVALKNESIAIMRSFAPEALLGPEFPKTRKGTIAHLRAPRDAVLRMDETSYPAWVVFPRFSPDTPAGLRPIPKAHAFLRLAHNSFNYDVTGAEGFKAVAEIVRACECFELRFSNLDQAIAKLDDLIA